MTGVLAIDPGNIESAYALIDETNCRPILFGKTDNADLMAEAGRLTIHRPRVAIEMIASYGMPVGAEVFETCVWIGRFAEHIERLVLAGSPELVYRRDVKLHHCATARANDGNIVQALVDRFAPGAPNKGKGTKNAPGWFYGFRADVWQAYALAVYIVDRGAS